MTRSRDVSKVLGTAASTYAPKASPTFTGTLTNSSINTNVAILGEANYKFHRRLTIPSKTLGSGNFESFNVYLGRFNCGTFKMKVHASGGYSEDAAEYSITRSYAASPKINSIIGANFENALWYHNGFTLHWSAVNELEYDIFVRFTYFTFASVGTSINLYCEFEQIGTASPSVPTGVTVPTLNSSNRIPATLISEGYQGALVFNPTSKIYTSGGTLAGDDFGRIIDYFSSSAGTITIPPNSTLALPQFAQIMFIQTGTGQLTVSGGAGVSVVSNQSKFKTAAQYAVITAWQRTIDNWILFGNLG
jgi:hypothetical protein